MSKKALQKIDDSPPPPTPKRGPVLVCVDGRVVGDAVVVVSEQDPNWWRGMAVREQGEIRLSGGRRLRWP